MKKLITVIIAIILVVCLGAFWSGSNEGGYLLNTTNSKVQDTIGSASTNDTSYSYTITETDIPLYLEFTQYSIAYDYKIIPPIRDLIRVRYLASDSTLHPEYQGTLSWFPCYMQSHKNCDSTFSTITVGLKTGNAILQFREAKLNNGQ